MAVYQLVTDKNVGMQKTGWRRWCWSHSRSCATGYPVISGSSSPHNHNPQPPP